jgi:RNA polymerase sigma factor (sigma-70 family)
MMMLNRAMPKASSVLKTVFNRYWPAIQQTVAHYNQTLNHYNRWVDDDIEQQAALGLLKTIKRLPSAMLSVLLAPKPEQTPQLQQYLLNNIRKELEATFAKETRHYQARVWEAAPLADPYQYQPSLWINTPTNPLEEAYWQNTQQQTLAYAIQHHLTPAEQQLLAWRYGDLLSDMHQLTTLLSHYWEEGKRLTYQQIGNKLGLTHQAIVQREKKLLKRLRRLLKPLLGLWLVAMGLGHIAVAIAGNKGRKFS